MDEPNPDPLAPLACRLQAQIEAQLRAPAALLAPAGLRSAVQQLGNLVVTLAARVDFLSNVSHHHPKAP